MSCRFFIRHFFLWRVPDYLMIIVMAIVAAVVGAKVRPHCRDFEWSDPSINHPHAGKEAFPMYSVVIAVIFIALVYFAGELLTKWNRPAGKMNMCLHVNGWIVTHAYSILLAFLFVNVSKLYAGRLRPDFIARLAKEGITEANFSTFTHHQICHAARNGRLSFPSGHSGTSFAGYVPPCLYLMGLMRTLNGGKVWLATIALLPLILPVAVAISRTVDYRHNFDDVLCGSICGASCGVFAVLISFRVSMRGEWTLRDHPDDVAETRAWLHRMLIDGPERPMLTVNESDSNSSRWSEGDSQGEVEQEVTVSPAVENCLTTHPHHQHHSGETKRHDGKGSRPSNSEKVKGDLSVPSRCVASLPGDDDVSPAVFQERTSNLSPSNWNMDALSRAY
ncbi:PAP2 superfamily [Lotmaria passim]